MKRTLAAAILMAASSVTLAAEHTVQMLNMGTAGVMVFEPAVLHVEPGDTVTFQPTNPSHNSESVASLIPEGGETWKGATSQPVTVTLNTEGVYVYECLPHAMMAMVGVIVVGEAVNLDEVKANAEAYGQKFVANQQRLQEYLAQVE